MCWQKIPLHIIPHHQNRSFRPAKTSKNFGKVRGMCFREMEVLERGEEINILRIDARAAEVAAASHQRTGYLPVTVAS